MAQQGCRGTHERQCVKQHKEEVRERPFDFYRGVGRGGGLEDFLRKKNPGLNFSRKKYLGHGELYCTYCIIYK